MSKQQQHNCFNKNEIHIILKSFLALTARKNFVPVPWFRKQKPLVSWFSGLVGKTTSWKMKNKKCIVFPKSRYVNLNPAGNYFFKNFTFIWKKIGLHLVQSNLESFLKMGMTCASLQMFGNHRLNMESLVSWEVQVKIFMIKFSEFGFFKHSVKVFLVGGIFFWRFVPIDVKRLLTFSAISIGSVILCNKWPI